MIKVMKKVLVLALFSALLLAGCSVPSLGSVKELSRPNSTIVPELPTLTEEEKENYTYEVSEYADVLTNVGQAAIGIPNTDGQVIGMSNGTAQWENGSTAVNLAPPFLVDNTSQLGWVGVVAIANWNFGKEVQTQYVVLFEGAVPGGGITQKGHLYLGDGLIIKNLEQRPVQGDTKSYFVDITYLDRNPGEPLTTKPSVEMKKTIQIQDGKIVGGECAYSCKPQ